MQFEISGAQARTLQEALTDAQDGSPVLFTKQDDGTLSRLRDAAFRRLRVIRLAKTTAVLGVDQDLSGNEPDERGNFVAVAALQSATGVESVALNLNLN
jgi:hypothetical protein